MKASDFPINAVCDYCHEGPKPCRPYGDLPPGPLDDVLMDAFRCIDCAQKRHDQLKAQRDEMR